MNSKRNSVPEPARLWLLSNFDTWLSWWVQEYEPPLHINVAVRRWVQSREKNPLLGARIVEGHADTYFAVIPETMDSRQQVVTCTYRVIRADWTVYCQMIGTASWPV
jgi:hypothetical protein